MTLSSSARIRRVIGAAVSAPKPPASSVTATTYFGFGYGASATYQDWSGLPVCSAVPVLPATGIGKPSNTGVEVPPGAFAAPKRPSRIASRFSFEMLHPARRRRVELLERAAGRVLDPQPEPRPQHAAAVGDAA